MPRPQNTIDSLMTNVEKQPNGCWLWKGRTNSKGYGKCSWAGKEARVHRVFYEQFKGTLADGMMACHTCDVRNCCNPDHLFAGTALDNERDKVLKGRWRGPGSVKSDPVVSGAA